VGGAIIAAAAACGGQVQAVPAAEADAAAAAQVDAAPQDGMSAEDVLPISFAVDGAVADALSVDTATADGPPDINSVDASGITVADASVEADATDAEIDVTRYPMVYRSPPRRSVWD
jgi:hypothetical protein